LRSQFRKKPWQDDNVTFGGSEVPKSTPPVKSTPSPSMGVSASDQALEVESTNTQSPHHALDSDVVLSNAASNMTYKVCGMNQMAGKCV
jgi:hypothetical protein